MERHDVSVSRLGKELAERDGHKPESKRRLVQKYLKGTVAPGPKIARQLAEILHEPEDYFVTPEDPVQRRDLETLWRLMDETRQTIVRLEERLREAGGHEVEGRPQDDGDTP